MIVPIFTNDRRLRSTKSDPAVIEHARRSDDPYHAVRQHFRFTNDEEADVRSFLMRPANYERLRDVPIKRTPACEEPEVKESAGVDRR